MVKNLQEEEIDRLLKYFHLKTPINNKKIFNAYHNKLQTLTRTTNADNNYSKLLDYYNRNPGYFMGPERESKSSSSSSSNKRNKSPKKDEFRVIKEMIDTPHIVIENEDEDEDEFPELPVLRRTRRVKCPYCENEWGDVPYHQDNIAQPRNICGSCRVKIEDISNQKKKNRHIISETLKNKRKHFDDIFDIGMHPDRAYHNKLADNIHLFRKPSTH